MLTLIFGIWASEPPRAWRTTEKAGPDRVNVTNRSWSSVDDLAMKRNEEFNDMRTYHSKNYCMVPGLADCMQSSWSSVDDLAMKRNEELTT